MEAHSQARRIMDGRNGRKGLIRLPFSISAEENLLFTDTLDTIIKIIPLPIIFRINRRWFCISPAVPS